MRSATFLLVLSLVLAAPAAAQNTVADLELPDLTPELLWQRSTWQLTVAWTSAMAYGYSQGKTVEDMAEFWVELFAPSWESAGRAGVAGMSRGFYANLKMWPGGEVEFTEVAPNRVVGSYNHPWRRHFGESGTRFGVTVADYERFMDLFMRGVARHVGLQYEAHPDGDRTVFSFSDPRLARP